VQVQVQEQVENCTVPLQDGGKGSRKGSGDSSGEEFQQWLRCSQQRGLMLS
jgi:hypothetical protein